MRRLQAPEMFPLPDSTHLLQQDSLFEDGDFLQEGTTEAAFMCNN